MTRSRDLEPTVIARYLSGESTPAESALVEAWIARDPRHRAEMEDVRRAWSASFPLERPIDVDGGWRRVAARMHDPRAGESAGADAHVIPVRMEHRGSRRLNQFSSLRLVALHGSRVSRAAHAAGMLAAAAVLLVAGTIVVRQIDARRTTDGTRVTREFASARGQRAIIDLADGTHVVLAPSTRLRVSIPREGGGVREVHLDGEAMFTVTHDPARPFIVQSRFGSTVDIGTSFAVSAYANETYRVIVRDGRVALAADRTSAARAQTLIAGDVATRGADGAMRVAHRQDVAGLLDWSSGRLTFDHRRFAELVPDLERWYGVDIRIASQQLRDRTITGQFDTESRSEAFNALGRALGARHSVDGSRITFFMP